MFLEYVLPDLSLARPERTAENERSPPPPEDTRQKWLRKGPRRTTAALTFNSPRSHNNQASVGSAGQISPIQGRFTALEGSTAVITVPENSARLQGSSELSQIPALSSSPKQQILSLDLDVGNVYGAVSE